MNKLALYLFLSLFIFFLFCSDTFGQAGIIQKITLKPDPGKFSVFVTGEGKLECDSMTLENPPRVAIDCKNVKNALYPNVIDAAENPYVYRVRNSLYAKGRDTISRITVELKNRMDYTVYKTREGMVLTLSPLSGQASGKSPLPQKQPRPALTTATPLNVPPAAPVTQDVVIGSEDLLEISVFELPQFNTTARVQGDGTITMPLVGSVEVRGLKKKDVEAKIAAALQAKYVNNPNVSVNVKEYKSRQVSLLGEVKAPGAYYVMSQRTLLQLLSEAGGLAAGAGGKCYIFRTGAPKIEIDLRELMVNGNPEMNILIYPGDVVNVPPDAKVTVYVLGAVRQPGAVQLTTSMPVTLLAAIASAGGPSDSAKQSDIRIKRKNSLGTENIIKANLKDILKGKVEDILLFEGDVVTVPESFF